MQRAGYFCWGAFLPPWFPAVAPVILAVRRRTTVAVLTTVTIAAVSIDTTIVTIGIGDLRLGPCVEDRHNARINSRKDYAWPIPGGPIKSGRDGTQ